MDEDLEAAVERERLREYARRREPTMYEILAILIGGSILAGIIFR